MPMKGNDIPQHRRMVMYRIYRFFSVITKPHISSFSTIASTEMSSASNSNTFIFKYLIENCGFSETNALSTSNRLSHVENPQKPDSVLRLFRQSGFSETHIQNAIRVTPQILVADTEKTLKPKLDLIQQLGLKGSDLGRFVSKNSTFLATSLERKLTPNIKILKKILSDDKHVVGVLQRCSWIVFSDPDSRLLPNISFLQSCGIVESQLSMLLKRQPLLFAMKESTLRDLVCRVKDMGFSIDSRMFVYALYTVSCMRPETLERKFEIFRSFAISKEESMSMFRRTPSLLRTSEKKLQMGLDWFLSVLGEDRLALVRSPGCLMYSMEKRVLPRYRVVGILKWKELLKKEPSLMNVVRIPEEEFLQKYIFKFGDVADELLLAYKLDVFKSFSI